jgi:hypothetical protein
MKRSNIEEIIGLLWVIAGMLVIDSVVWLGWIMLGNGVLTLLMACVIAYKEKGKSKDYRREVE